MKAEQLRKSILQLAIQGKLVPQDTADEPASVLLERIRAEKQRLIKEGKIKKDKGDSVIFKGDDNCYYEKFSDETIKNIQDEIPFDLPDGWSWSRLNSISSSIQYGLNKSAEQIGTHKLLRITDIQDGFVDWNNVPYTTIDEYDKYQLRVNDIVFARTGATVGKSYIIKEVPFPTVYASYLIRIRVFDSVCADYIYAFFNSGCYWGQITDKSIGVGQPNCNGTSLSQLFIPIPPIAEQLRVLDKAKESLTLVRSIEKSEKTINESKTLLKSKILELAIQGKLVPQDENDEPASVLLERIRAERKAKLGKKYVESYIFKRDDNCYYEHINGKDVDITEDIPFDLPDSWAWSRWGELSDSIQYGYNAPAKQSGRIKMVRISDIHENQVMWENVPYCDIAEEDISTYLLKENDILFARTGGTVGKSFLVKNIKKEAIYAGYLIRTRYNSKLIPQYFKYFMESPLYWSQLRNGTIATAQPNCNGQTLSKMIVPVPPLAEQKRIVEKIDEIFSKL